MFLDKLLHLNAFFRRVLSLFVGQVFTYKVIINWIPVHHQKKGKNKKNSLKNVPHIYMLNGHILYRKQRSAVCDSVA